MKKTKRKASEIFTLGYQEISILQYIDVLKENKIRLVCDVRNNAFSFKMGFSKKMFKEYLAKAKIKYLHLPALGVDASKRKEAGKTITRKAMFRYYVNVILKRPTAIEETEQIQDLLKKGTSLVLTCYEKDPTDCHRSFLANKIKRNLKNKISVHHLRPVE